MTVIPMKVITEEITNLFLESSFSCIVDYFTLSHIEKT